MTEADVDPGVYHFGAAAYEYVKRRCHEQPEPAVGRQRVLTAWSLAVLQAERPDVQLLTGRLIQYERPGNDYPGQIAPDHFIAVHPQPLDRGISFDIPYRPVGPLLVADYFTAADWKYEPEQRQVYRDGLKVPYYLQFGLTDRKLFLLRLVGETYRSVKPDAAGRRAIPELELEAAVDGGRLRFWFRGELLPLPDDVVRERRAAEVEPTRLRAELDRLRGTP